ncbi:hypothetical protein JOD45_000350 [Scopulibacillus daqui]|uniref:DUF2515 domain-containing protein n=1 Tax=Scopulibacillus daqui TaxID=1469162 RepID=A0ABS2PVS1_9BACL|nr:hypothetical protein [Scopulibacillus daqui]
MLYSFSDVKKELKRKSKGKVSSKQAISLSEEEKKLIHFINKQTEKYNQNNVTRTHAYFNFYLQHPDIHWAFLGHMVSRNGGWNMTDLKGELFTKLLSEDEQRVFFSFLERGNWLIFQDVYPQFLLYEQCLKRNKKMFYLLPFFDVSTFMETMWNYFWENRDPYPLCIATIINEQHYLEKRVMQNNYFKKAVLSTVGFKLYDFFRFNHILFPYYEEGSKKALLVGETSRHFTSVHERILLGKRLYALLFRHKDILSGAYHWAKDHPHTGSRKDYWPHLFNDVNESFPRGLYRRRIKNCQLRKGAERLYSPPLKYAWANVNHKKAESGDWFNDWHVIEYLTGKEVDSDGKIYNEYCKTLEKIELTIMAKKAFLREEEESK